MLEDANIKLGSVVSDVMGESARAILKAVCEGETDPEKLADRVHTRLQATRPEIVEALRGCVRKHHRFLLRLHVEQIEALDRAIGAVEQEVGEHIDPFRRAAEVLTTIPVVSETTAQVIVGEIGPDMSRFATAAHLVSWAGLCPASHESAGKRRPTRTRKSGKWLKTALVQAAQAAVRTRDTYLRAQYYRIKARRGPKKAVVAVAASIVTAVYFMLRNGVPYRELGGNYFDTIDRAKAASRLVRRLRTLGYEVAITETT